ncbi:hypothetical protein EDB86DRAFT_2982095, partial [Lactarius hatsudake]
VPSLRRPCSSSCSFPALRCRHLGRRRLSSLSLLDLITGLSCVFSVSSAAFGPASRTRAVPTTRPLWRGPSSLVVPQEGRGHVHRFFIHTFPWRLTFTTVLIICTHTFAFVACHSARHTPLS